MECCFVIENGYVNSKINVFYLKNCLTRFQGLAVRYNVRTFVKEFLK